MWLLFLDSAGDLIRHRHISGDEDGFMGGILGFGVFGTSVARIGDLDGNGFEDMVVGEPGDKEIGSNTAAFHVLFLYNPMCPADVNFDGVVDLLRILADWGADGCANNGDIIKDDTDDGVKTVRWMELLMSGIFSKY